MDKIELVRDLLFDSIQLDDDSIYEKLAQQIDALYTERAGETKAICEVAWCPHGRPNVCPPDCNVAEIKVVSQPVPSVEPEPTNVREKIAAGLELTICATFCKVEYKDCQECVQWSKLLNRADQILALFPEWAKENGYEKAVSVEISDKVFDAIAKAKGYVKLAEVVELLQIMKDKDDTAYDEINWRSSHLYDMDKVELHHKVKANVLNGIIAKVKEWLGEQK